MNVQFTDVGGLSARDFVRMRKDFDQAGATVMTVVLLPNGEMHVLSPYEAAWTRHFLITAGVGMGGVETH